MRRSFPLLVTLGVVLTTTSVTEGTDLVTLSPQTFEAYAPEGKEADAIYGDFVLRNENIVAVIARPVQYRNANMMVRDVGGMIIDLTRRDIQRDQLQVLYAAEPTNTFQFAGVEVERPSIFDVDRAMADGSIQTRTTLVVKAESVTVKLVSKPDPDRALVELSYTLRDGSDAVEIRTTWTNNTGRDLKVAIKDLLRAERSFDKAEDGTDPFFWVEDKYFGQAYGLFVDEGTINAKTNGYISTLSYTEDAERVTLAPGESVAAERLFFPGANLFDLRAVAADAQGIEQSRGSLMVVDQQGKPVADADVSIEVEGELYGHGRTNKEGLISARLPENLAGLPLVTAPWGATTTEFEPLEEESAYKAVVASGGLVVANITDENGGPIPCKVQFTGTDGTETPDFGPDTGVHANANLYYSHNGHFEKPLAPGTYDVIVSYGPEYDAVFTELTLEAGEETELVATLKRTVDTTGWVSSDFHSHSTPSGDNSSSQCGRVLNLLCEHVEFAPCTEHNRLSTYVPHLRALGVEQLMATCTGIELTSRPGDVNHQNSFPLVLQPHVQDGGAPMIDLDPEIQVERLAVWDGYSEKVIQQNHPDLGHVFFDRNGDGEIDGGFSKNFGYIDSIEIHPPSTIFLPPVVEYRGSERNNDIVNWMQMLNQGMRYTGVVNTDAHYNVHGSGWLRNFIKSSTDDTAEIDVMEMVYAVEGGNLVMSSGPFLEATVRSNGDRAIPGETIELTGGSATLSVKVQCPNWFDVDRVQVFVNGRAVEELNFTREANGDYFGDGVIKFDREIPLTLDEDAHIIVATIGENSSLSPVMGELPEFRDKPVAVTNPIYLDVDGEGFTPNEDTLGAPLPTKRD